MWPIPTIEHELVTFCFSDDSITCSWIHKTNNKDQALLKAYQRCTLNNLELEKLILFNPTRVKNIITNFLSRYNKNNAFIAWSFDGASIIEEYRTLPTSTPKKEDFGIQHSHNILWQYEYLYQNNDGSFVFYVYKIPRSVLLQYKLLTIASQCNVITMTTQGYALLQCYKHIFGNAFRTSQLAVDMITYSNNPLHLISSDMLQKVLTIPATIPLKEELPYLAASYGLFINQGM